MLSYFAAWILKAGERSLRSGPALEKLMGKSGQGRSRQWLQDWVDLAR